MEPREIVVKGAREHNLRDVSLTLPRNQLICFTGVSGSGKSSLAFDTLYAEGQRRYVESLSAYARQFLGQLTKPDVDIITGLSPSISIQQKTGGWNPRSTVATITQIHDFLRVLFARVGNQYCTKCCQAITAQSREQIVGRILSLPEDARVLILAPVIRGQKGEYRDLFQDLLKQGFARARVDGQLVQLGEDIQLDRNKRHDIEVVIDRLQINKSVRPRVAEAVDAALQLGDGTLLVHRVEESASPRSKRQGPISAKTSKSRRRGLAGSSKDILLSSRYACTRCDLSFEPPSPQMFSFNSPTGMCLDCDGLGTRFDFDASLLVPDPKKSFLKLAIEPMRTRIGKWRRHTYRAVAQHVGFDLNTPWMKLSQKAKDALLYGTADAHLTFEWRWRGGIWKHGGTFDGVVAELHEKHRKAKSTFVRAYYEKYMRKQLCPTCGGSRLNRQALSVKLGGLTIQELLSMPIGDALTFIEELKLNDTEAYIADEALKEIRTRLQFLIDVGLHYLALDRTAPTLSGGESQRIRLASQIGAGLVGVLYVLDEPSIGLHARDNRRLLDSLRRLCDLGNTVIVVEHDEETMRSADYIVDFGPGPGVRGGEVVAQGRFGDVIKSKQSITGQYLTGKQEIGVPNRRRAIKPPPKRK